MEAQRNDKFLEEMRLAARGDEPKGFTEAKDNALILNGRLCVPQDEKLKNEIMSEAHETPYTAHPGSTKLYIDLKNTFWWKGMKKDIASFVERCLACQQVKAVHQRPYGTFQPLPIPEWKWEHINMDFVVSLPRSMRGNTAIWVIVDRLSKSAHFLPIQMTFGLEKLAKLYVKEIVRLHGIPVSITSDRDSRFISHFQKSLQEAIWALS